jgi:hypothetical protein
MDKKYQSIFIVILLAVLALGLFFSGKTVDKVNDFVSCVDAGNPVMESYPRQCKHNDVLYVEDIGSDIEIYFRNELYEQAVENAGGFPIEGFNPGLYMVAFPGFIPEDFGGAEAIGGIWAFNQELKWIEFNLGGPITSADGTLNDKGLNVLLKNLEKRFEITANSEVDVDQIISMLSIYKCGFDERLVDACISLYDPVCGWNDPDKIKCIKYPCAQDYSNGCEACQNEAVAYYTPGMCPSA